jgi:hypothetical protein
MDFDCGLPHTSDSDQDHPFHFGLKMVRGFATIQQLAQYLNGCLDFV